jgi:hypothetical protein
MIGRENHETILIVLQVNNFAFKTNLAIRLHLTTTIFCVNLLFSASKTAK